MQNKVLSLLGLATRSRNLESGEFMTEKAVKQGKAYLVIVATDSSDNTKKQFENMCNFYKVPICFFGKKEELGHAVGKAMRASLAVCDEGFSNSIIKLLNISEVVE